MRLTKQEIETQNAKRAFSGKLDEQFYRQMRNELLDYKFIEEELGIDLVTLFKALKNGIWLKDDEEQFLPYHCLLRDDLILVLYEDIYKKEYLPKDYGKTWALTRRALNSGK